MFHSIPLDAVVAGIVWPGATAILGPCVCTALTQTWARLVPTPTHHRRPRSGKYHVGKILTSSSSHEGSLMRDSTARCEGEAEEQILGFVWFRKSLAYVLGWCHSPLVRNKFWTREDKLQISAADGSRGRGRQQRHGVWAEQQCEAVFSRLTFASSTPEQGGRCSAPINLIGTGIISG